MRKFFTLPKPPWHEPGGFLSSFFLEKKLYGNKQFNSSPCAEKQNGKNYHLSHYSICKESRKNGGRQSHYRIWLQSWACGGRVPLYEAGIPQDHRSAAGKGRRDRLSSAAILQAGRDHAGGSQPAGVGAGETIYKRKKRLHRR